ncbi:MAG: hypothetical protein JNK65_03290, partial [Deltaproteobacteria bacterium]|nr:hypothetical protein [Deltaproteobacteria bacterium]
DLYTKGKFVLWSLIYLLALMNFVTGFIVLLGKKNQAVSITMIFSGLALAMIGFGTCFMTILSGGVH